MGKRVSWGLALIGSLTGLLVVSRNMTRRWVPEIAVVELLSVVILLTGVLHMIGGFRLGGVDVSAGNLGYRQCQSDLLWAGKKLKARLTPVKRLWSSWSPQWITSSLPRS